MDSCDADLYERFLHMELNKSAIVRHYEPKSFLERFIAKQDKKDNIPDISEIIKSLEAHETGINKESFEYNIHGMDRGYEVWINPKNGAIVAGFSYLIDENQIRTSLDKVIYLRNGENAVVISYKKLPRKDNLKWEDKERVASIFIDNGFFELGLMNLYQLYKRVKSKIILA